MTSRPIDHLFELPANAIVSAGEAGGILKRHPETLRRWRHAGGGPDWLVHPKRADAAEYRMVDLKRWVDKRSQGEHQNVYDQKARPRGQARRC